MYGQLPSYVLANATTFDIMVANALAEYEHKQLNPNKLTSDLTQEEMVAMLNSVRSENDTKITKKS